MDELKLIKDRQEFFDHRLDEFQQELAFFRDRLTTRFTKTTTKIMLWFFVAELVLGGFEVWELLAHGAH